MTMWLGISPTKIDGDNADEDIFKDYDDDAQNDKQLQMMALQNVFPWPNFCTSVFKVPSSADPADIELNFWSSSYTFIKECNVCL